MTIYPALITLLLGVVVPGLTALITKDTASVRLKALLSALLAAVAGGLTGYITTPPANVHQWETVLLGIGFAWITAGVAYLTGWKPTGAAAYIDRKTHKVGFGGGPIETLVSTFPGDGPPPAT